MADTADFGRYGPYRLGMTAEEIRAIAKGTLTESTLGGLSPCKSFADPAANSGPESSLGLLLPKEGGNRVVGIRVPIFARTTKGIGYGSTADEARAAYHGMPITESDSQVGTELLVQSTEADDSFLGFTLSKDKKSIMEVRVGDHDYAANYELCSG